MVEDTPTPTPGVGRASLIFIAICIGLTGATVSRCEAQGAPHIRVSQVPPPPAGKCGGPCWNNGVCFAGCGCIKPDPWTYGECMSISETD